MAHHHHDQNTCVIFMVTVTVFLLAIYYGVATAAVTKSGIDQVTVREYEAVTLLCDHRTVAPRARSMTDPQSVDYRGYTIRWLRNNVTILSADNKGQLSLDIPKASRYDAGVFECELLRDSKVIWRHVKRLRVGYAPIGAPIIHPESLSGHYFVPEGQSVSLTCHLTGDPGWPPAVPVWRWRRGPDDSGECCTGQREMVIKASARKPTVRQRTALSKRNVVNYFTETSSSETPSTKPVRKNRNDDDEEALSQQQNEDLGESWSCFYKNELGSTRLASPRRFVVHPAVTVANYSYTKPTDQVAVEGETVTFSCNVSNPAVVVHWNVRYDNQPTSDMNMLLTGGNGVLLRSHELSPRITSVGHLNLVIANVTRDDEAIYICKVGSNPWAEAKLTVLVRPSVPKLTRIVPQSTGVAVRSGQRVTFNCSTDGGNPAPKIEWSRSNGVQFDADAQQHSETSRFGATWSTVTFHVTPDDDNTDVVCTISHQLLQQPIRAIETLRVEYAPIVTVNPPERLRARLGSTASVHCTAKANPPVTGLAWIRPGGPMGAGEHTLSRDGAYQFRVERTDSGTLICRASNSVGEKEQAIGVEVLYPPELSVTKGPISVLEGSSAVLRCEAVASPSPSILRWRRVNDGAVLAEVADSGALIHAVDAITRQDAGMYACEAKNTMVYPSTPGVSTKFESEEGSDVKQVEINVLYPPGKAKITNGAIVTVVAGESVRLFCEVEDLGNPSGTVSWYRLPDATNGDVESGVHSRAAVGRSSGTTAELRMENVSAERVAGLYECLAENKFGRGTSAIVTLVVNEQPRWTTPLVHSQRPLWKAQDYTLSCTAAGNPAPVVTWQRNGHSFAEDATKTPNTIQLPESYTIKTSQPALKRGLYHVDSWLRFPHNGLNRNDSGLYSCKAENKLGVSTSQTTVTVLYPPAPITTYSKFSANVGRSARLRFMVYSASKPRFYWSMEGSHIANTSGRYYITERGSTRREMFESILIINQVTEKDFGLYTIRAENDQGRTGDTVLRLVEPGVPDPPVVVEAGATSWDSAKLIWQPGFDGGSPQSIEVLVFEADQTEEAKAPFKTFTIQMKPSAAKIMGLIGLTEDGSDLSFALEEEAIHGNELNVTGLMPGQGYEVRLRGINHYGAGELSESVVRFTTPNLTEPSEVYFNPLANALQYRPADPRLCVRIAKTVDGGRTWQWLDECIGAGRGVSNLGTWPTGAVAIALQMCLIDKPKTCTGLVSARARHFDPNNRGWSPFETLDEEGVSSSSFLSTPALILGVAAGIGATLILLLVSIVVVCRRRKASRLPTRADRCSKDGIYSLCGGRGNSGISSRGSSSSSGGMDDASSKPVLLSAGSGGCYAAIDSVVSVQQHSGSTSGVSGSSPLDMSELLTHPTYTSSAAIGFSSIPQQSFLPQHYNPQTTANGWSHGSTTSGSTESAVLHVDDSNVVGEDITAMLRRICSQQQQQQQQQHDTHSDHSSGGSNNNVPLLSTAYNQQQLNACQTPDSANQQRRVRYEVVV